ncbi:DUF2946 family protein [Sphingomonas adhaesiva]|uniref:DUF2946 family protein n=1 Tax=Sphingomonas adhaesiva TaxID=28212 RepID=UPI002FF86FFA
MHAVRHLVAQRHFAVLICTAALLLKLLVPAGYMIDSDHGRLTIRICSGVASASSMAMDMPGMHGSDMSGPSHDPSKDHGKAEMPCAFTGLSASMLGATDPIQLAALIAFIAALGLVAALLPAPSRRTYLRPPLRGPPAFR